MKKIKPVTKKLVGFKVKMEIDGKKSEFKLSEVQFPHLKNLLSKRLKGIVVSYSEIYE